MIKGIAAQRPFDQGIAEAEAAVGALLESTFLHGDCSQRGVCNAAKPA